MEREKSVDPLLVVWQPPLTHGLGQGGASSLRLTRDQHGETLLLQPSRGLPYPRCINIRGFRLCVRLWGCSREFPSARPLPSTSSAAPGAPGALFGGFLGTMSLSDFPIPYITAVPSQFSVRTQWPSLGRSRDLPVPAQNACRRAKVLRPRRSRRPLASSATVDAVPAVAKNVDLRNFITISRLHSPAHLPPVNASSGPLRDRPHDSGPTWFATPFVVEDLHLLHSAGLPALSGKGKPEGWSSKPRAVDGLPRSVNEALLTLACGAQPSCRSRVWRGAR